MALLSAFGLGFRLVRRFGGESSTPAQATPKNRRDLIAGLSDTDIACNGQAWGAETAECLAMIAKESGQDDGPQGSG